MGFKRLTIVREVPGLSIQGYPKPYKVYLAEDKSTPSSWGMTSTNLVYLSTMETYRDNYVVNLEDNDTTPLSSTTNGNKVYVQRAKDLTLSGKFTVRQIAEPKTPIEHFRNMIIDRSEYVLYDADHYKDGKVIGALSRVFSKASPGYMRGEDIPSSEVTPIFLLGQADGYNYYIQDHAKYIKRVVASMPRY